MVRGKGRQGTGESRHNRERSRSEFQLEVIPTLDIRQKACPWSPLLTRFSPLFVQYSLFWDMYGFEVQPRHLELYLQYATIYKEEEVDRSEQWDRFLSIHSRTAGEELVVSASLDEVGEREHGGGAGTSGKAFNGVATWGELHNNLGAIEKVVKRRRKAVDVCEKTEVTSTNSQDETAEKVLHTDKRDVQDPYPWEEELEFLVRGGAPMALRGELWQVFVGANDRRVPGHYNALLTLLADGGGDSNGMGGLCVGSNTAATNYEISNKKSILEKWTSQIEKDLPRTFPGHPALDEDGQKILRRLLTAYARHNPSVGYCQAMNFLAALLLLLMPEENAFWTLTGIIDDYFKGYYSEKMVEAQVDQLVFEQLVREHFPRLVDHLDILGVQVAWVSGPWFLSIFVNVLPWESVLRVWDVLLFEGNRVMLFRTALALVEVHVGPLMQQKDAGDAVSLLQSMAGATFDSSQLVLTACVGFQTVDEARLRALSSQHRPGVVAAIQARALELEVWRSSNALPSKAGVVPDINAGSVSLEKKFTVVEKLKHGVDAAVGSVTSLGASKGNEFLNDEANTGTAEHQEQIAWLKAELCRALEDRQAAILRAEELETALVEMAKEDNRRELAAKVEKLEEQVYLMKEQEQAMLQVVLRLEQEQHTAIQIAEEEAAAQCYTIELLKTELKKADEALSTMKERVVMAESMLEATLQFHESVDSNPQAAGRPVHEDKPIQQPAAHSDSSLLKQENDQAHLRRGSADHAPEGDQEVSKISNGSAVSNGLDEPPIRRQGLFSRFSR